MKLIIATLISSAALVATAHAADPVVYDTPAEVVVSTAYDWTGFYIGGIGGLATGDSDLYGTDGFDWVDLSVSASGGFFGGQVGYDWQSGSWVFGAVADIAATSYGAELDASTSFGFASAESTLDYLGTVRGRVGYAFDRALFYGHGGFAYGQTSQTVSLDGYNYFEDEAGKNGWTLGAGAEYAITDRVSLQTEYSYVDLGEDEIYYDGIYSVSEDVKFHQIKAAINFRF